MKLNHLPFLVAIFLLPAAVLAQGSLENPSNGSTESGINILSGWHCSASVVEAVIDGTSIGRAYVGSDRGDTASICGKKETGFALLINYNILSSGPHNLKIYANGSLFGDVNFETIKSAGAEYLRGLSSTIGIPDFPAAGSSAILEWRESRQGYIITKIVSTSKLDGSYKLIRASFQKSVLEFYDTTANQGLSATGTLVVSGNSATLNRSTTLNGVISTNARTIKFVDNDSFLYNTTDNSKIIIIERGAKLITSAYYYDPTYGWLNEVNTWLKVK